LIWENSGIFLDIADRAFTIPLKAEKLVNGFRGAQDAGGLPPPGLV